jgi:O-antigen/teichoic acid export membrane protein
MTPAVERPVQEEHRSRRELFALRTIKADVVCRLVQIAVRLISVPMGIALLGMEKYGLWQAAGALLTWVNLSQMGLGGGLVNEVGRAMGRNDRAGMKRLISTAYLALAGIAGMAWLAILVLSQTGFVATILSIHSNPALLGEARLVFAITGTIIAATILINTITAVCAGLQEMYIYSMFLAGGSILAMVVLTVLSLLGASLPAYTAGMGLPPLLMMLALNFYMFGRRHPDIAPSPSLFDRGSLKSLWSFGGFMLVAQVGELMVFSSASPLIAAKLGFVEVTRYAVAFALPMLVVNVADGICRAYLGGYCEAVARHDWEWIHQVAVRTRRIAFSMAVVAGIGMTLLGPFAIRVWAGKTVVPSTALMGCMAVYSALMIGSNTNTTLLLGLGNSRLKAYLQSFVAAAHFAGFFLLVPKIGLYALPVAGAFGYLGDVIVSYSYTARYVGRHLREARQKDLGPVVERITVNP